MVGAVSTIRHNVSLGSVQHEPGCSITTLIRWVLTEGGTARTPHHVTSHHVTPPRDTTTPTVPPNHLNFLASGVLHLLGSNVKLCGSNAVLTATFKITNYQSLSPCEIFIFLPLCRTIVFILSLLLMWEDNYECMLDKIWEISETDEDPEHQSLICII